MKIGYAKINFLFWFLIFFFVFMNSSFLDVSAQERILAFDGPILRYQNFKEGTLDMDHSGEVNLLEVESLSKKSRTLKRGKLSQIYHGIQFHPSGAQLYFLEGGEESRIKRDEFLSELHGAIGKLQAEHILVQDKYQECKKQMGFEAGNILEQAVLVMVNYFRQKRGLPMLRDHPQLRKLAREHSQYLADHGMSSNHHHFDQRAELIKKSFNGRKVAENVADNKGKMNPARSAYKQWKHSPGHNKNMQIQWGDGVFAQKAGLTGIGVVKKDGHYYFTQVFSDFSDISDFSAQENLAVESVRDSQKQLQQQVLKQWPLPNKLQKGISKVKTIFKNKIGQQGK